MPLEADHPNPIGTDANEEPTLDLPDLPPDSYWIPKEDEFDWYDRNAFMERKGSTKAISGNSNFTPARNSTSSSQRPCLTPKSNVSIIGLPKFQISRVSDGGLRRNSKPEVVRLFRSRSEPDGKSVGLMSEPGSPMVSCMGRVRSKKKGRMKRTGMWASLRAVFRAGIKGNRIVNRGSGELVDQGTKPAGSVAARRLVSGMRSESWGGNRDQSEGENPRGGVSSVN